MISGVTTTSDIKVGTGITLNVYGGTTYSGIVTALSQCGEFKTGNPTGIGANCTKVITYNSQRKQVIHGSSITGLTGGKFNGFAAGILTTINCWYSNCKCYCLI